jgi:hypothetical protein
MLAIGILMASAGAIGCAPGTAPGPSPPAAPLASSCLIAADSAAPAATFTAAFDDTADARLTLLAATRATPVRLDCAGRPSAGLARAWSSDTSGRFWTLDLDARGDTSARWTASNLVATWRADPAASAALRWSGVRSLLPLDERRLVADLETPFLDVPTFLADRALGVPSGAPHSPLTVAAPASGDLRDAIDGGTDLVVTGDPALLDYARRRPGITAAALPWHRTYVLLLPPRSPGVGAAIPADTVAFQTALARDAVRADARAAAAPFWWEPRVACLAPPARETRQAATRAIAYPLDDPVARDLAERIVALAGPEVTARALAADSFAAALRLESQRGYVLRVPRHAPVPCRETASWPAGASVIPLVDTRPYALLRHGSPALLVEWDGAIRLAEPGDTSRRTP